MVDSFFASDPQKLDSPYEDFAWYRKNAPIYYHEPLNQWFVFGHDDVAALLKDQRLSADRLAGMRQATPHEAWDDLDRIAPYFESWVLMTDGDQHRRLRAALHRGFSPEVIRGLQSKIEESATMLVHPAIETGSIDVASDYAFLLTAYVLADFLGVHPADRGRVVQWSMDFIDYFNIAPITVENTRKMVSSGFELIGYTRQLFAERRANPVDDFLGTMLTPADEKDALSDDEMVGNAMLLLLAGHIAVRNFIGNAIWLLVQHPDQMALLRSRPELLHNAVEECLRFEAPVAAIPRVTRDDFTYNGHKIPKGSLIQLVLASANRDEAKFAAADVFDITRTPAGIMSFGSGPHACLGAILAREETEIAIKTLLATFSKIEIDPQKPIVWYRNLGNRGPEHLSMLLGR